jgi:hypothetical protein
MSSSSSVLKNKSSSRLLHAGFLLRLLFSPTILQLALIGLHGVISPQDGTLHNHRCENLKSYRLFSVSFLKSTYFMGFYQLIFIRILQMLWHFENYIPTPLLMKYPPPPRRGEPYYWNHCRYIVSVIVSIEFLLSLVKAYMLRECREQLYSWLIIVVRFHEHISLLRMSLEALSARETMLWVRVSYLERAYQDPAIHLTTRHLLPQDSVVERPAVWLSVRRLAA